jgi:hypothetical protein
MTKGRVVLPFKFDAIEDEQQVPPLRSPGFPVDLGGVGALHAPFSYRKAHTRPCPVQRGMKSGYAPAGMTKGRVVLPFKFDAIEDEQQVPSLLLEDQKRNPRSIKA